MSHIVPAWPLLSAFLIASFILAVTPGPGGYYIVTRSLLQGRRSGLASVAGVALGNFGNAVGASIGLAALFAVSSRAFMIIKYAGSLYLVYLGVQALRASPPATAAASRRDPECGERDRAHRRAGSLECSAGVQRRPSFETSGASTSSPAGTLPCSIQSARSSKARTLTATSNAQCPGERTARWTRRCDVPAASARRR